MLIRHTFLAALALAACNAAPGEPAQPETITDQSGAVFGWSCDDQRCYVEQLDESPMLPGCEPPSGAIYGYVWGSTIEISAGCAVNDGSGSWGGPSSWGRFVVCEEDADCPTIISSTGADAYLCHAGFCRSVESADSHDDLPNKWMMEMLCFGHLPRFEAFSDPETWAAIEAACPGESINSPCNSIPAGCADPRG